METVLSSKKRKVFEPQEASEQKPDTGVKPAVDEDDTDVKLAILSSLYPFVDGSTLLDTLISANGSVDVASSTLSNLVSVQETKQKQRSPTKGVGYQSSLSSYGLTSSNSLSPRKRSKVTKKGQTLHLYSPEDIKAYTPCSIIHNFLPLDEANDLLKELLLEAPSFEKQTFKLFDNVVQSPHSACFYVQSLEERHKQRTEYLYNGAYLTDIRQITPHMRAVSSRVAAAVNHEITTRIKTHYPNSTKLKHQSPNPWVPNAAFVNCYAGGAESVGYHSDQLTYLGPRAVIGSISLGVAREFRVRRIVARDADDDDNSNDDDDGKNKDMVTKSSSSTDRADAEGQIAIHLPHNSLLVMHAEMQEEWKHSIAPARAIDPHPVAGNRRINITYRHYREEFHPKYTPRCRCDVPTVLRCVQRRKENWGRYMWMCHAGNSPEKEGCSFFQWAEFDEDGNPPWSQKTKESQALRHNQDVH